MSATGDLREPDEAVMQVTYTYSAENDAAVVGALRRRFGAFCCEMKQKGIHVGVGSPPVSCVTCGEPWPCPGSSGTGGSEESCRT